MKEILWEKPKVELANQDNAIIRADIEYWNDELASSFGFPDLIPNKLLANLYYIAVARNSNGDVVGAKVLQEYIEGQNTSSHENLVFLTERAQRIFGLKIRSQDDS